MSLRHWTICEISRFQRRQAANAIRARFMNSLEWVDKTYVQKHRSDDPANLRAMYYPTMRQYSTSARKGPRDAIIAFLIRYGRRAGISLAVYMLSYVPVVGRFILPAASFYTFNKAVGPKPAVVIFGSAVLLPRRYLVTFLQSYFSSRSLMRELVSNRVRQFNVTKLTEASSSLTSPAYTIQRSRGADGSATGKVYSSASVLASSSF